MKMADKVALIEDILNRAAEKIGDITEPALQRYYQRCPEARASFEAHARGNQAQLEGQMVENSLYVLMSILAAPGETEILLGGSVLHHHDTLRVPPKWYGDLIEATADVVADTIPPENTAEQEAWSQARAELQDIVNRSAKWVSPRVAA
jgi:hypothetical protein